MNGAAWQDAYDVKAGVPVEELFKRRRWRRYILDLIHKSCDCLVRLPDGLMVEGVLKDVSAMGAMVKNLSAPLRPEVGQRIYFKNMPDRSRPSPLHGQSGIVRWYDGSSERFGVEFDI